MPEESHQRPHGLADGLPTPINSFYDADLPPRNSHGNRPNASQGGDHHHSQHTPSQFQAPLGPNVDSPADLLEAIPSSAAPNPPPEAARRKKKGKGKLQIPAQSKLSETPEELLEAIPVSPASQSQGGGPSKRPSARLQVPAKEYPSKTASEKFEAIPDGHSSLRPSKSTMPVLWPSSALQVQVPPKQVVSKTPSQLLEAVPASRPAQVPTLEAASKTFIIPAKLKSALKPAKPAQASDHSKTPTRPAEQKVSSPSKPRPGGRSPIRRQSSNESIHPTLRGRRLKSRSPTPPPHERRRQVTIISRRHSSPSPRPNGPKQGGWKHHRIEDPEASDLLHRVIHRIQRSDMSKLWDQILLADQAGAVSHSEYLDIQCFFYRFLPMIIVAPECDPVIVSMSELRRHERVLDLWDRDRDDMSEGSIRARAEGMRTRGEGRVGGHGLERYSRPRSRRGWLGVDYWEAKDRREKEARKSVHTTRERERSISNERKKKGFFR